MSLSLHSSLPPFTPIHGLPGTWFPTQLPVSHGLPEKETGPSSPASVPELGGQVLDAHSIPFNLWVSVSLSVKMGII